MSDPIPINNQQTLLAAKEYANGVGARHIKTASATLTRQEQAEGVVVMNVGGAATFVTLVPVVGDKLIAVSKHVSNLVIDLPSGATIDGIATTGQNVTSDGPAGESIVLQCFVAGQWTRLAANGTWTAA